MGSPAFSRLNGMRRRWRRPFGVFCTTIFGQPWGTLVADGLKWNTTSGDSTTLWSGITVLWSADPRHRKR